MAAVLVTGANGHIGAQTVRRLLEQGHKVIGTVREGADMRGLQGLDVETRYADVMDADAVNAAIRDCDAVIHCAAVYAIWAKNVDDIVAPSIVGTQNVFRAAKEAGVQRIVFTSSIAAIGFSDSPESIRTADNWNLGTEHPYFVAKMRGEQEAIRLSEEYGIDLVRLCPAMMLGPYDYRVTPSTKLIMDLINGSGITYSGGMNIVHVQDVAMVHAKAVELGEPGKRYIIGGTNLDMHEIGDLVEKWTGIRPRHLGMGRDVAMAMGSVLEGVSKLTGKEPQFTRSTADEHVQRWQYFDCSDTYRTFDYTPTDADTVMRDTVGWLLYLGKIRRELQPEYLEKLSANSMWIA